MTALTARQEPDPALDLEFPAFGLERPVAELDARIAQRTELMLDAGWLAETKSACQRYPADCPGLLSIGYREIVRYLQGEVSADELAPAIVLVTRQYAKRQRTLFRHLRAIWRGHPEAPELAPKIGQILAASGTNS